MADPKIRIKRSAVAGRIPSVDQVPLGELALNTWDGQLYASKNVGLGTTVVAVNPWLVGTGTDSYNAYFTAGNIGIGSTTPTSALHVVGDAYISGVVTANAGFNLGISSAGSVITSGPIKTLNFIGAGNTFLVNGTTVDISIQGGSGGEIGVQANDSVIGYAQTTLNFVGSGVTGVSIGTTATITIEPGLVGAAKSVTSFTATTGQTTFNVNYSQGQENVFLNGVRLSESQYTATNGSTVVLNDPASDGDSVDIVVYLRGADPNRNVEVTLLPPFNGITTAFTMYKGTTSYLFDPIDERQIVVSLGGVIQQPGVAYTVGTGSSIFFSAAPGAATTCFITALYSNTVGVPTDAVKLNKQTYTPSGIQTTFTVTEGYSSGYLDVYRNGIRLVDGSDFTASNGTTFDLVTPATGGDVVDIIAYQTLNIQYSEFAGLSTNVDGGYGSLTNLQVSGISTLGNVYIGIGGTDLLVEGNARVTGILTVGPGSITFDGVNNKITGITQSDATNINVTGVTTAQSLLVVGSGTTTGIADQPLQVFGKGYFSNRVGINTTDPTSLLNVVGGEVHIKSGGVSQVPLRIKRSSSGGRAQFAIVDENDNQIWRLGSVGGGGTYFSFYHQLQDKGFGKTYGVFGPSDGVIPKDYFSLEVNQYVTIGSNADFNEGIHLRNDGGTSLDTGNAINFYGSNDFTGNIISQLSASRSTYNHGFAKLSAVTNNNTISSSVVVNSSDGPTSDYNGSIFFRTGDGEIVNRAKIDSNGTLYVGGNVSGGSVSSGGIFYVSGISTEVYAARHGGTVMFINRNLNDGELIQFRRNNSSVGNITVSSGTVTLTGGHLSRWTQLPGNGERVGILTGTVMSNIDEMCEWIDPEVPDTYWTEYDELPKGVSVGDIKNPGTPGGKQENIQLNRMKISDVEGDPNVAGVFQSWDDDDDYFLNDIHCAMTGDFVIRVGAGVTVQRGDLLMSAGDGTAKPQEDDIIRSKTIAKVTSVHTSMVFDDGSYCVPCVLMAC